MTWLLSVAALLVSGAAMRVLVLNQPIVAMLVSFTIAHFVWATTAWLESNDDTCFDLWAGERALAPAPLESVLGGTLEPKQRF